MDHRLSLEAYSQLAASQSAESMAALPANDSSSFQLPTQMNGEFDDTAGLLRAHEYERQRMGQELHDCAGQLVISLELSIARLSEMGGLCSHGPIIEEIQETVRKLDNEIRTLAFLDYPAQLGELGLFNAVRNLARGLEKRTGIETRVEAVGKVGDIGEAIATALLRVAQEALANIHRHARASFARIVIKRLASRIQISVEDNGIGMASAFGPGHSRGIGLQGMRHRVESLGGAFKLTELERGTRISAWVPLAT